MRFISRLIWICLLLVILAVIAMFVIANPTPVTVSLWPLSDMLIVPLWSSFLGAFGLDLLVGGFFVWLAGLPARARLAMTQRKLQKTIEALEAEKQRNTQDSVLEISGRG